MLDFDPTYLLIFAAAGMFVFGIGAMFEKRSPVVRSIRRGGSSGWFAINIASRFQASESETRKVRLVMLQAGYEALDAAQTLRAVRMLLLVSLPLGMLAILPIIKPDISPRDTLVSVAVAAILGFLIPTRYVQSRRARRQQAIRNGLPDVLDLLLVSTEAGLGLDTAILRVGEETANIHPIISEHLHHMSSELRAGRPREEAFRGFNDRCGVDEVEMLVNLLIQSDALGTSMAATLRAFADDMRAHRLLRAEEKGQKMSVKLSGVLAGCFIPCLLIAIMAPALAPVVARYFQ
jgi:tight adherence protein C